MWCASTWCYTVFSLCFPSVDSFGPFDPTHSEYLELGHKTETGEALLYRKCHSEDTRSPRWRRIRGDRGAFVASGSSRQLF